MGKTIEGFTPAAREALLEYDMARQPPRAAQRHGTRRDLRRRIAVLDREDLPGRITSAMPRSVSAAGGPIEVGEPVTLEQLEAEHIRLILAGSPSREDAARILGIDPSTLYRKRKQLGL